MENDKSKKRKSKSKVQKAEQKNPPFGASRPSLPSPLGGAPSQGPFPKGYPLSGGPFSPPPPNGHLASVLGQKLPRVRLRDGLDVPRYCSSPNASPSLLLLSRVVSTGRYLVTRPKLPHVTKERWGLGVPRYLPVSWLGRFSTGKLPENEHISSPPGACMEELRYSLKFTLTFGQNRPR